MRKERFFRRLRMNLFPQAVFVQHFCGFCVVEINGEGRKRGPAFVQPAFVGSFVFQSEVLEGIDHPEVFLSSRGDAPFIGVQTGPVGTVPAYLEAADLIRRAVGQIEIVHAVQGQVLPVHGGSHARHEIGMLRSHAGMGTVRDRQRGKSVHGALNGGSYGAGEKDVLSRVRPEIDAGNNEIRLEFGHETAQRKNDAVRRGSGHGHAFEGAACRVGQGDFAGKHGAVHGQAASGSGMLFGGGHGTHVVSRAAEGGVEMMQVPAVYSVVIADQYAHGGSELPAKGFDNRSPGKIVEGKEVCSWNGGCAVSMFFCIKRESKVNSSEDSMTEHQKISRMTAGDEISSIYLVALASLQQSRNGPYWRLELKDASGSLEAKVWSPLSLSFSSLAAGQMVQVEGRVSLYRDQLQLTVDAMRVLDDDEIAALPLEEYMLSSPRPAADMLEDVERLCDRVLTHKPWKKFMRSVLSDKRIRPLLLKAPAAKSVHHAYAGGLLEHMLSVAELCMLMADHYSELDRQTLLAAALLHDIGKIDEMGGLLVTEYTDEGRLLGHIVQGIVMLEPYLRKSGLEPELVMHFKHLIASHHGELQFGAVREPSTPEAFVLHYADNVDAKLAQCRGVLPASDEENGVVWSAYQSLLGRSVCRPAHTPEEQPASRGARQEKKESRQEERQCSLL